MAGGGYQDETEAISEINVTPLVDVVLVLLVLFMVTAPMMAARGIMVDSPKTVSGDSLSITLKITLTPEGVIHVNEETFAKSDLDNARLFIENYAKENPDSKAVISADTVVPHGDVMSMIDQVKLAGINKFALLTAPKEATSP